MDFTITKLSNQIRLAYVVILTLTLCTTIYQSCESNACKEYYEDYRFNTPSNSTINSTPFIHSLIERLFERKNKIFFAVLSIVSNSREHKPALENMMDLENFLLTTSNDDPRIISIIATMYKNRWWDEEEF